MSIESVVGFAAANREWLFSGAGIAIVSALVGLIVRRLHRRAPRWAVSLNRSAMRQSGDHSVNIQGGAVTVGASLAEVRQIAMDVYEANFYRLQGIAQQEAERRASELTQAFLEALEARAPDAPSTAGDPDMQYAIFNAQVAYARTGDVDLRDVLVDILADRSKAEDRNLLQIVLSEALVVAPKLTSYQYDTLSVIFLLRYTTSPNVLNLERLKEYASQVLAPFVPALQKTQSCYQHLDYAGCGSVLIGSATLHRIFTGRYGGLFSTGFTETQAAAWKAEHGFDDHLFMECLHHPSLRQIDALNEGDLRSKASEKDYSAEKTEALVSIFNSNIMSEDSLKRYLGTLDPSMVRFIDVWEDSPMKSVTLSSVGIAIAHANVRRKLKMSFDLGIWIK